MRTSPPYLLTTLALCCWLLLSGCGAANQAGIACKRMRSNTEWLRGVGVAESQTLATARDKARLDAYSKLATVWATVMDNVLEPHTLQPLDEILKLPMNLTNIGCTQTEKTWKGRYRVYMVVEMSKAQLHQALEQEISHNAEQYHSLDKDNIHLALDKELENVAQQNKRWWIF